MARYVTGTNKLYQSYLLDTFKGGVFRPETNVLRMGLLLDTYEWDANHSQLNDVIPDEVSGNGYNREQLTGVTVEISGLWVRLRFNDVTFVPAGGNIEAKYWFLYDESAANSPLIAYGQIDATRETMVTVVDGKGLDIACNELGLFRVPI